MASWNQKEQEEIEFRIGAIKKFLEIWFQYDELFQASFGTDRVDQKSEDEFLQLKSQLARRHQYLLEYLGGGISWWRADHGVPFRYRDFEEYVSDPP